MILGYLPCVVTVMCVISPSTLLLEAELSDPEPPSPDIRGTMRLPALCALVQIVLGHASPDSLAFDRVLNCLVVVV
jgi:hypothetical protein